MQGAQRTKRCRAGWLLPVLACLLTVAPLSAAPRAEAGRCPSYRLVPGIGTACRGSDGLLRIKAGDGSILVSHGPDPVAGAGSTSTAPARPPSCATGDYYIVPIYAHAADDGNDFATRASTMRGVIQQANGFVDSAAAAVGSTTDLRVACSGGSILIQNVSLPTKKADTTFSTIVTDLKNAGFNNPHLKYWVYFDEHTACGCAGMANLSGDDRLRADNANNGNNSNPMYAVVFGYLTPSTLLHELAHTMGALQDSAPHTTGRGHCTDGRDVMCYKDGGPRSGSYTTSRCSSEVFDCGRDDYFNPVPPAGSYLATHWNLGSRLNRYLAFDPGGAPVMNALICPGKAGLRHSYSCYVRAADTSTGVAYIVNWGDGSTPVRVPRSGFAAPNTYLETVHAYKTARWYRVTVYAVDNGKPARSSRAVATSVQALIDRTPPSLHVFDPAPGWLYKGCDAKTAYVPGKAAIAQRACLLTRTSDVGTGVAGIWIYVNGRLTAVTYPKHPEWRSPFNVKGPATGVPVRIEVRDYAGNVTSKTFLVDILL